MPKGDYAKRKRYEQEQKEMAEKAQALNGNGGPAPQGHTEAPASASARMVSPVGIEWMLTVRDDQVSGLLKKIQVLESHLMKEGWQPARSQAPAQGAPAAGARMCPDGHGPMKESTKAPGEYFCPAVVGTHPQTGKKLYCTHKA